MKTTSCENCNKVYSLRTFVKHIRVCDKEKYEKFEKELENFIKVCACGKTFCEYKNVNDLIMSFLTGEQKKKIYCSRSCYKKNKAPWNKGKTKEDNHALKKISESRMGLKNPIHKVLSDADKKAKWVINIKEGNKEFTSSRQGKTLEELYGEDKAKKIKHKQTESAIKSAKTCHSRGMKGKKHSEETKRKIALKTSDYNSKSRARVSNIQKYFFDCLGQALSEYDLNLEYRVDYYSIDIAIPNLKIAIEVDGDYWHSNKALGYKANNPILENNLKNDKNKQSYLTGLGWYVIRIWESDINKDTHACVKRIQEVINERMDSRRDN